MRSDRRSWRTTGFPNREPFDLWPQPTFRASNTARSEPYARNPRTYRDLCGRAAQPIELVPQYLRYSYRRQPEGWSFSRDGEEITVRVGGNLEANNGDALRAAARAGLGIVYLPDFIAAADIATGELVRLLADWDTPQAPIHAVFPSQRHPSAKLRAFVDFLAGHFANGVDWAQGCQEAMGRG